MFSVFIQSISGFRTSDDSLHLNESFHRAFSNEWSILLVSVKTRIMIRIEHALCARPVNSVNIIPLSLYSPTRIGTESVLKLLGLTIKLLLLALILSNVQNYKYVNSGCPWLLYCCHSHSHYHHHHSPFLLLMEISWSYLGVGSRGTLSVLSVRLSHSEVAYLVETLL